MGIVMSARRRNMRALYVYGLNTWMTKKSKYCATVEMVHVDPGECLNIAMKPRFLGIFRTQP